MIMIDPKMLELSTYDGIPHLLTPVVTDPKQAVVALKWTVREMEDRYRKMSKLGVRNIDGYNLRLAQARSKRETLTRTVQTGFDPDTGEAIYETGRADPRTHAVHRRRHRRDGRPDDGRRQGHRRRRPAPRPDGPRRRHPRHHGNAAPVGRRHHRHDQGQLPDPHFLPGHLQDRLAAPFSTSRAPSSFSARATCSYMAGRRPHPARPRPLRQRPGGRGGRRPPQIAGRTGVSPRHHRRRGRGRRRRRGRHGWRRRRIRTISTTAPSPSCCATARPRPATSSAACRSATTAPPRSSSAWRRKASSAAPITPASAISLSPRTKRPSIGEALGICGAPRIRHTTPISRRGASTGFGRMTKRTGARRTD